MPAGGPRDHPITDLLAWNLEVYGPVPDDEFRQLAKLLSERELHNWWQEHIGWDIAPPVAAKRIHEKLRWAQARAKTNGWDSSP